LRLQVAQLCHAGVDWDEQPKGHEQGSEQAMKHLRRITIQIETMNLIPESISEVCVANDTFLFMGCMQFMGTIKS
jgi:hypothetical protein